MIPNKNKFGLARNIPESVKREVRQRSGFGCVLCGLWLYTYEHIEPEFHAATTHDPNCICLLCPNHHSRVTKGLISKAAIMDAYRRPRAIELGYGHDREFWPLQRPIEVALGQLKFIDPTVMISTEHDEVLLAVSNSEIGTLQLSGKFYDSNGRLCLEIVNNEWRAMVSNWDVSLVGNLLKIVDSDGNLVLSVRPVSKNKIVFDYLHMYHHGFSINTRHGESISILSPNGGGISEMNEVVTGGPIVVSDSGGMIVRGGVRIS